MEENKSIQSTDFLAGHGYVYGLKFPNDKWYIGQTYGGDPEKRWNNGNGYKNQPVYKAIEKYGWDNIKKIILYEVLVYSVDNRPEKLAAIINDLNDKECEFAEKYNSIFPNGYNFVVGDNKIFSDERNAKVSASNKGKPKSDEHRKNISLGRTGIQFTEEHIQNVREAMIESGRWSNITRKESEEIAKNGYTLAYAAKKFSVSRKVIYSRINYYGLTDEWLSNRDTKVNFNPNYLIVIPGSTPSLKNSKQLFRNKRTGKMFITSSSKVKSYNDMALYELEAAKHFTGRVKIRYRFYYNNAIRRDLDNSIATINDLLVKAGIIEDDSYKNLVIGNSLGFVCKENPRTEIEITQLDE